MHQRRAVLSSTARTGARSAASRRSPSTGTPTCFPTSNATTGPKADGMNDRVQGGWGWRASRPGSSATAAQGRPPNTARASLWTRAAPSPESAPDPFQFLNESAVDMGDRLGRQVLPRRHGGEQHRQHARGLGELLGAVRRGGRETSIGREDVEEVRARAGSSRAGPRTRDRGRPSRTPRAEAARSSAFEPRGFAMASSARIAVWRVPIRPASIASHA